MPEGDTIYRAARTMQTAIGGQLVTNFETALAQLARVDDQQPIAGRTIESVEPEGKHLLIHFSGDLHLRTHMRMNGSWHLYRPGERWRKPRREMRVVIETSPWVAVGFNIPVAEFHDGRSLARQEDLSKIGPDFLGETFDVSEALQRMKARGDRGIGEVLLNQRVAAGVGNEYKSEVLFIAGVDPARPVVTLTDEQLVTILETSRKLMLANVRMRTAARVTTGSLDRQKRTFVYGRGGQPCRRCGTRIEYGKQGKDARGTYWCPKCQT
jgi:endonuclease VIII